ncbi:MAG: ABC transporter substrate-binding protein [Eubacteriales bacterium]|nr:ABC transporter substrate-binding protein [Eubacteriales bacterium]
MKRILCLLLAASVILAISPTLAENVDDSLIVGIYSTRTTEIRPLDPKERDIVSIYGMVYESLVTVDDNGLPQPLLAENWTESGDGKTWTFTLRENVTFSDGTPLTAGDVAASCNYLLTLANGDDVAARGFYQNIRYIVASASASDDRTVVVKAKRPYYGLLYELTFPVVPASQVDVASPLGTGPYVISSFEPANYIWLKTNDFWWQTHPQVKEIMISLYSSNKDLITAYEYGRVDTAFTRSVAASQYKSGINSLSITYSTRQLETLLLNNTSYPLDDVNVRKAIRAAIDTSLISTNVYMGMTVDADTPISSSSWLYYDQESTFKYNLELAQQLLADDGWSDIDNDGVLDKVIAEDKVKHLYLRLLVYEDPENDVRFETANMIADMLNLLKISVTIDTTTYEKEQETLAAGSFDMALASFQMDVAPDAGFMLMKGNSGNFCRYVSSEMTSLFNTLRTNQNRDDYAYTMQAIQQQFANDAPFICLFYRAGAILTRKMYTTVRDIREFELLRGIEAFGR